MKINYHPKSYIFSVLTLSLIVFTQGTANAQNSLQNGVDNFQPSTTQTQQTTNALNQTSSLQQNTGQTVLSDSGLKPLGVVNDPRQLNATTVVQPDRNLTTSGQSTEVPPDVTTEVRVLLGILIVLLLIVLVKGPRFSDEPVEASNELAATKLQAVRKTKKSTAGKKKQTRKQRKKTTSTK